MSSEKYFGSIPFKMNFQKESIIADNLGYGNCTEAEVLGHNTTNISFPSTRTVLWNRHCIANNITVNLFGTDRKLQLIINERALQLAFKQLQVIGRDYNGYFIGDFHCEGELICVQVDRFDPGRDAQIQTASGIKKTQIPTTSIPGDLAIPAHFLNGMAFVDHETTTTHTVDDFLKNMQILNSWCSRKDKLDAKHFLLPKIKCCFQQNGEELLAYITCGCLTISSQFDVLPINPIPVIQTALARNLMGQNSLTEIQGLVKTGFVTMDQTRKLLLLLETDPKAYDLPLVGIWLSGVESTSTNQSPAVKSPAVWAACTRFSLNKSISERVYAPPQNYLLIIYSPQNAKPQFFEFYQVGEKDHISFDFVSCCDGIQLKKMQHGSDDDGYVFDLAFQHSGLLVNNFNTASEMYIKEYLSVKSTLVNPVDGSEFKLSEDLDDSIPNALPSPQPHPHRPQAASTTPSVSDLSICDTSVVINTDKVSADKLQSGLSEKFTVKKKVISPNSKKEKLLPRQTKASIARINLNKTAKSKQTEPLKKKVLAINFPKASTAKQQNDTESNSKIITTETHLLKSQDVDFSMNRADTNDVSVARLPVQVRIFSPPLLQPNYVDWCKSENEMTFNGIGDFENSKVSYHAENYSDMQDDESFVVESWLKQPNVDRNSENNDKITVENSFEKSDVNVTFEENNNGITSSARSPRRNDQTNEGNVTKEVKDTEAYHKGESSSLGEDQCKQNDLLEILHSQQHQLAELQAQLKFFMEHQKQSKEAEIVKMSTDELLKKELEDNEVLRMQRKQQNQLDELQKQLQLFLKLSAEEEKKKVDTSIQCVNVATPVRTVQPISVGTNTGESLLFPMGDMATTNSDTTPRGMMQASRVEAKTTGEKRKCECCEHCHRIKKSIPRRKSEPIFKNRSTTDNASFQSGNFSEIGAEDINSSMFNDTASSTRTLASSLKAVDIPVFDDSQEPQTSPSKQNLNMLDWNSSPMLGESASMLIEQRSGLKKKTEANQETKNPDVLQNKEDSEHKPNAAELIDNNLLNNKEFYAHMMVQVKKMMEGQGVMPEVLTVKSDLQKYDTQKLEGVLNTEFSSNNVLTEKEQLGIIRDTTIKKLQEMVQQPNLSPIKDEENPNQYTTTPFLQTFPRINYISMATDDTFCDHSEQFNAIASKYLPPDFLLAERKEVRNKTVKFEGFYEWQTSDHVTNATSVNFSCNMSIASKKYLQKYDLSEVGKNHVLPLGNSNGIKSYSIKQQKDLINDETNKENILDFKKLKALPKLL